MQPPRPQTNQPLRRPYEALYVHVPFCRSKCDYCAFYSTTADPKMCSAYLRRLRGEFEASADDCGSLSSIFIGGGTPTCLLPAQFDTLLDHVAQIFATAGELEFSTEANPDSLTAEHVAVFAARGLNRVSLGVQSFQHARRQTLGRQGDLSALNHTLETLRSHGIGNLNLDLIYAIPGQTLADWKDDVRRACDLGIRHLSTYALTIEEGSRLAGRAASPPDDATAVAMWEAAAHIAAEYGLQRYEVSNLACPGHECRHNLEIWRGGTYLGCGPAAASFDGQQRRSNPPDLHRWLAGEKAEVDQLPAEARAAEVLAFGLRTVAGWDEAQFRARTGYDLMQLRGPAIRWLIETGLLVREQRTLHPTRQGLLFADTIAEELL